MRVGEVEYTQLGRLVLLVHRHRELLAEYVLDAARVHAEQLCQHGVQLLHLALQRANLVLERAGHAFLLGTPPLSCAKRGVHRSAWSPVDHLPRAKRAQCTAAFVRSPVDHLVIVGKFDPPTGRQENGRLLAPDRLKACTLMSDENKFPLEKNSIGRSAPQCEGLRAAEAGVIRGGTLRPPPLARDIYIWRCGEGNHHAGPRCGLLQLAAAAAARLSGGAPGPCGGKPAPGSCTSAPWGRSVGQYVSA